MFEKKNETYSTVNYPPHFGNQETDVRTHSRGELVVELRPPGDTHMESAYRSNNAPGVKVLSAIFIAVFSTTRILSRRYYST